MRSEPISFRIFIGVFTVHNFVDHKIVNQNFVNSNNVLISHILPSPLPAPSASRPSRP